MKEHRDRDSKEPVALINERIRAPRVQLITHTGDNIGVVSRHEALQQARDAQLDLVMIAECGKEGVPVVKIIDHGKALYEKKKKHAEAKKHQKVIQVKEIKMSPKIGEHDYQTKMKRAMQFLSDGKRVKVTLFFRGRERATKEERGKEFFEKIDQTLADSGFSDNLVREKDAKMGPFWSRVYYIK
ncbi:translation initiation factor IF-3 [Candidatus Dependentiae bacterium]|nr:translation initiation factor IF-3 [Candidatus Dependentiae bacterium]